MAMVDAQSEENSIECATLVETQVKCRRCGNVFLINSDLEKHMIFVKKNFSSDARFERGSQSA